MRPILPLLCCLALAGCGSPPPVEKAAPRALTDKQAIDAATATERKYQDALAKGDLAFLAECSPDSAESLRLVEMSADDAQGYSLAVMADARGAVAIWQGLQRIGDRKYQAFGPRGMRLDVNGWRQLRQQLVESRFVTGQAVIGSDDAFIQSAHGGFLVFCLDGERRLARESDGPTDFDRIAVKMRRLGGNHYSPPAQSASQVE